MNDKLELIQNLRKQIKRLEDEIAMERFKERTPPTEIVDKMKRLGFELDESYIGVWCDDFYYLAFASTNYKTINISVNLFGNRRMNKIYCYEVFANDFQIDNTSNIIDLTEALNDLNNLISTINQTREIIGNAFPDLVDGSEDMRKIYNQLKKNNVLEE